MKHSWIVHDMVRICPQTGNIIENEAALKSITDISEDVYSTVSPRNAYVSFQIAINVNTIYAQETDIFTDALEGEDEQISSSMYNLFVQWYHQIQGEYIPDALIPWGEGSTSPRPFAFSLNLNEVPDQGFGAVWVDLFIPADVKPGEYRGAVYVKQGEAVDHHTVSLQVLNTIVPNETTITADLNSYADSISLKFAHLHERETRYRDGSYFQMEKQFFQMSHEHRSLFHSLPYQHSGQMPESFAPELEGSGKNIRVKDWSLFDEHFGPYLDGTAFKESKRGAIPLPYLYLPQNFHWPADYAKFGMKGYATEFKQILNEFYEHFTKMGWLATKFELFLNHKKRYKLFPYDGDETRFIWDEKINDIFYDLAKDVLERKDGAQFIFRTDSSWCYGLHYKKYADIIKLWVASRSVVPWFPDSVEHLHDKGAEIWLYGGAQKIAENLLGTAISPIMCVARGVDGFNYWNTIDWGKQWYKNPANDGGVTLFYPGDQLFNIPGPLPSIRLKVLRNAMQVSECMEQWIRHNQETGRQEMGELINTSLGVDRTFWWGERPDLVDLPPYEWTNELLSDATPTAFHKGRSPEVFNQIKQKLWSKLG
jgi:hypothetical protein